MYTLKFFVFIFLFASSISAKDDMSFIQNQNIKREANLGLGETKDTPSRYIAPIPKEILDYNITIDYTSSLCFVSMAQYKKMAISNHEQKNGLQYVFKKDKQKIYFTNATDIGDPRGNILIIKPESNIISINSQDVYYKIGRFFNFRIDALFPDNVKQVSLECISFDKKDKMIYNLPVNPDNLFHNYRIHLKNRKTEDFFIGQIKLKVEFEYLETKKLIKIREFELK